MNRSSLYACIIGLFTVLFLGCNPGDQNKSTGPLKIVCTTNIIADVVGEVVGDDAEISCLMGPGVDPHLYKASQGDVALLTEADVIIYNGLHLEGKMAEILEKLAKRKVVLAMADGNPNSAYLNLGPGSELKDPHFWFDPDLWMNGLAHVSKELAAYDTAHAQNYLDRLEVYSSGIQLLADSLHGLFDQLPENNQLLVTSHDAFQYFSRAFGFDVLALQGISTVSETSLKEISIAVNEVVEKKVPTVFIETSVSPQSIKALVEGCKSKGHEVQIGQTLYSDAMGAPDSPAGSYEGMLSYNAKSIVKGLLLNNE
jgi:manganese/zinc/iron transport system substrate-binding protein